MKLCLSTLSVQCHRIQHYSLARPWPDALGSLHILDFRQRLTSRCNAAVKIKHGFAHRARATGCATLPPIGADTPTFAAVLFVTLQPSGDLMVVEGRLLHSLN